MVNGKVHPYIPNSEESVKKEMLKELGIKSAEDIFDAIPEHLRFRGKMNLPDPILSEARLRQHVEKMLAKNRNCKDNISFLGGGCWQHHVPSVCDTIAARDEFLTAYVGEAYSDHGKFQALFETSSMIGDLTGFDACNTPTYDWASAIAMAGRMACRTKGRQQILVSDDISPGRLMVIQNYWKPEIELVMVKYDYQKGCMDLNDLKSKISNKTTAVYFENPSYLGFIETKVKEIVKIAHSKGAFVIVGADPSSLGVLEGPGNYGADYAVGDYQPLGLHLGFGGNQGGWVATGDSKEMIAEYPSLLFGVTETVQKGEWGFGEVFYERTSYANREKGKDFVGTTTALFGIVAGVYMALMGPQGFKELGEGIMQRVAYAKSKIADTPKVKIALPDAHAFKEFIVDFNGTKKTVAEINKALMAANIFGGKDISKEFPVYGQSALYCIAEMHTKEDIDNLVNVLAKVCAA
jgi:glycine dehydrogenase subunit 1